jgi:hypothetical protein
VHWHGCIRNLICPWRLLRRAHRWPVITLPHRDASTLRANNVHSGVEYAGSQRYLRASPADSDCDFIYTSRCMMFTIRKRAAAPGRCTCYVWSSNPQSCCSDQCSSFVGQFGTVRRSSKAAAGMLRPQARVPAGTRIFEIWALGSSRGIY